MVFKVTKQHCKVRNHSCTNRGFCACAIREDTLPLMKDYQLEYSRLLEELVNSGRYDTRDDFTVVLQPHQRDLKPIVDVRSINYP